jgi:hypothetical protein
VSLQVPSPQRFSSAQFIGLVCIDRCSPHVGSDMGGLAYRTDRTRRVCFDAALTQHIKVQAVAP